MITMNETDDIFVGDSNLTPQEVIEIYHDVEYKLKNLMNMSLGLDHITSKYLELISIERDEASEVLRNLDFEELIKFL